jgi:hypothetical protein
MWYCRERAAAAAVARPKVKKNAALLSFEDDEGADEDDEGDDNGGGDGKPAAAARIRSAHEAIDDARYTCLKPCQVHCLADIWHLCAWCLMQLHTTCFTSRVNSGTIVEPSLRDSHQAGLIAAHVIICRLVKVNTEQERQLAAQEAEETAVRKAAVQVRFCEHVSYHLQQSWCLHLSSLHRSTL